MTTTTEKPKLNPILKLTLDVGPLVLFFVANSRFGTQLRSALNQSWNIDVYLAQGFRSNVQDYVQRRAFAFVLTLAGEGARRALGEDVHLRNGLNVYDGMVTHRAVADALKIKCTPAEAALRL